MSNMAQSILRGAAKGSSWSQFLDYASPAFFDVMPVRALLAQGKEFVSNSSNSARFAFARERIRSSLQTREMDVRIMESGRLNGAQTLTKLPESMRREIGHRILGIYFAQLFDNDQAILDLRTESFAVADHGQLLWQPRSFYVEWQKDFLTGLRNLYHGFYLDQDARFVSGLQQLGLEASGDVLLRHLGSGDQRKVRFETSAFHDSFHETFLRCAKSGVALHRNFLALGLYLVCLYDVLESLGVEFDVRGAFERVHA